MKNNASNLKIVTTILILFIFTIMSPLTVCAHSEEEVGSKEVINFAKEVESDFIESPDESAEETSSTYYSATDNYLLDPQIQQFSPEFDNGFFQTSLYTGSANYVYNIEVPPGTNGMAPEITLTYSSQNAKGPAGWAGLGWSLNLNYIQRNVKYTPDDTGDDSFELIMNGQKYDLVYSASDGRYHTKIESYLYIEKISNYWIVKIKDGVQYRFGYNTDSRVMNSIPDRDYVWRWYLDEIKDTHDNKIYYWYVFECDDPDDGGMVYLNKIEYNNDKKRVIDFISEPRDDRHAAYDQGSKVCQVRRLKEINVSTDGNLVRKYILDYKTDYYKSLLESIKEVGSDGSSPLPAVTFTYYLPEDTSGFDVWEPWYTDEYDIDIVEMEQSGIFTDAKPLDINRDGLVDYTDAYNNSDPYNGRVFINNGEEFESPIPWYFPYSPIFVSRLCSTKKSTIFT